MILIALMWAWIPPGHDDVKRVILKLPFIVILNQWQTLYSGFRVPILGEIYTVAIIIKGHLMLFMSC